MNMRKCGLRNEPRKFLKTKEWGFTSAHFRKNRSATHKLVILPNEPELPSSVVACRPQKGFYRTNPEANCSQWRHLPCQRFSDSHDGIDRPSPERPTKNDSTTT